jgi:hypothetical protein
MTVAGLVSNLRVCTSRQNKGNANKTGLNNRRNNLRATTSSSAFKGVCWDARRERWRAQVAHKASWLLFR